MASSFGRALSRRCPVHAHRLQLKCRLLGLGTRCRPASESSLQFKVDTSLLPALTLSFLEQRWEESHLQGLCKVPLLSWFRLSTTTGGNFNTPVCR